VSIIICWNISYENALHIITSSDFLSYLIPRYRLPKAFIFCFSSKIFDILLAAKLNQRSEKVLQFSVPKRGFITRFRLGLHNVNNFRDIVDVNCVYALIVLSVDAGVICHKFIKPENVLKEPFQESLRKV
tara:strand:+ start:11795 stop:12184 length:390 start_codon:yes stop_codon:yes gene_type:complete